MKDKERGQGKNEIIELGGSRSSGGRDRIRVLKESIQLQFEGGMIVRRDVKGKKCDRVATYMTI